MTAEIVVKNPHEKPDRRKSNRKVFRKLIALVLGTLIGFIAAVGIVVSLAGIDEVKFILQMDVPPSPPEPCVPIQFDFMDRSESWSCGSIYIDDPGVGDGHQPNIQTTHQRFYDGKESFFATYTIDEFGRRRSATGTDTKTDSYLLFFGGSQTFGEGLNDDQTLPEQTGNLLKNVHVYNYGVSGYGPHNMLAKLESPNFHKQIAEKKGALIFQFITSHVERVAGGLNYYGAFHHPYYYLDADGNLQHKGTFLKGRPYQTALFRILGQAGVLSPFGIEIPFYLRNYHYELTAKVFQRAMELYREEFDSENFFVMIFPKPDSPVSEKMIAYLEKTGVPVLNYLDLFDSTDDRYQIPMDGHPNALANSIIARQITHDLYKKGLAERR